MVKASGLLLLIACGLAGCSGSESASMPTAPSSIAAVPQVTVAQDTWIALRGFVMDTAFRTLPGARVEVVDGPSAGVAVVAGADGEFVVSGAFGPSTQFRAVKDGHETRTQAWTCATNAVCSGPNGARPWLGFYLTLLGPTVNIAGDYMLTFTADSACTDLPSAVRTRSYQAVVTPQSAAGRSTVPGFDLKVVGAPLVGHMTGFPIGVAGDRLNFWLHGGHDPAIVEDLGANTYLAFSGSASVTLGAAGISTITAAFEGWIEHSVLPSPLVGPWYYPQAPAITKATCESRSHGITLTRP